MDDFYLISKKAADLLSRRPHFRRELELKLLKRGYCEDLIIQVLDDFEGRGYLDDRSHAQLYIEELQRKRYGRYEIVRRLRRKGLDEDFSKELVNVFSLENAERENINYLLNKRGFNLKKPKELKKALDFLNRRGFSSDITQEAIKQFLEEV